MGAAHSRDRLAGAETHLLMNNCYANYATTNARELAATLANLTAGDSEGRKPEGIT